jgi:hypothetical protein
MIDNRPYIAALNADLKPGVLLLYAREETPKKMVAQACAHQ